METSLPDLQRRVLEALAAKPLSDAELVAALASDADKDIKAALFYLTQAYLITKQPVMGGGCRDCACQVSYAWRLTLKGREAIKESI